MLDNKYFKAKIFAANILAGSQAGKRPQPFVSRDVIRSI
jgi:hypothetical protein